MISPPHTSKSPQVELFVLSGELPSKHICFDFQAKKLVGVEGMTAERAAREEAFNGFFFEKWCRLLFFHLLPTLPQVSSGC